MSDVSAKREAVPPGGDAFPQTAWTLVQQAVVPEGEVRDAALNELAARYWQPIYVYLRRTGRSTIDAEDLTQAFFIHLLEKDLLVRVKMREVRFRAFLKSVLENFLANTARTAGAKKRFAGFTLDVNEAEHRLAACNEASPDAAFDGVWAMERLESAVGSLRLELQQAGRAWVADALLERFGLDARTETASVGDLGRQYGVTENQLSVALHRARKRLRQLLIAELSRTTTSEAETADELAAMFAALGKRSTLGTS
ncbi:MAG: sigma-70 family RNA polymerase sigma factor [Planctomycetia bacterium]|nr:sigma-70 family RNA polymerase sigma factor [Planctomycetia bacterium]